MSKKVVLATALMVTLVFASVASAGWLLVAGKATDVTVGGDGTTYIVGSEKGGYGIYKYDDGDWDKVEGASGYKIAAENNGNVWTVDMEGVIWQYRAEKGKWRVVPGKATDIAIGPDNTPYIVGSEKGGYRVFKYVDGDWENIGGLEAAYRISVDKDNNVWTVNEEGGIYQFRADRGKWRGIAGKATDIGAGANGGVVICGSEKGGFGIYEFIDEAWEKLEGESGITVGVNAEGKPWITNQDGAIFKYRD